MKISEANKIMARVMSPGSIRIRLIFALILVCFACVDTTHAQSFVANLDASQVVGTSTETGTAVATFTLDAAQENLSYSVEVFGLDLKPESANRTGFSDITAIHVHNGFFGSSGPHVLNIFGVPSEDDAEAVFDFNNETLSGVYNDADAIDPTTGALFDQNSPLTTKLFSNFVDDLLAGQLYLAIHTAGQDGNIAIRGQIIAVPEPSSVALLAIGALCGLARRRRRS